MMSDFPIDLLIRQTLRSFVFDSTNMGIMTSKAEHFQARNNVIQKAPMESTFWGILKSPELMKNLYDKPSEYVHKLYENEVFKEAIANAKDEQEVLKEKNQILFQFLKDVRDSRPPPAMEWIAFQHYMYYVYRNFLTPTPVVTSEILPSILIKKLYALIVSLTHEDKTQFYIRIITLLREYVWVARDNFEQIKTTAEPTAFLICLLAYYSAFCSAANKLSTVLSDFDQFINERFHINWYCLNQRIFYQYFYSSAVVQDKIHLFEELANDKKPSVKKLLEAYKTFLDEMKLLDGHWQIQRKRMTVFSDKNCKIDQWPNDWKVFGEITKIMKTNYWIIRSDERKTLPESFELDSHILALVGDTWHIADRLIASKGNCICEDCMTAEFRVNLCSGNMVSVVPQQCSVQIRHITCYICRESIALEALASHIVTKHADLTIPRADLTKTYKWHLSPPMKKNSTLKRPSAKLCKVLSETMEELAKKKDSVNGVKTDQNISECGDVLEATNLSKTIQEKAESPDKMSAITPVVKIVDTPEGPVDNVDLTECGDDIEACRLVFEEYIKSRKESFMECFKKEETACCGPERLLPKINGLLDKTNGLMKKEKPPKEDEYLPFDPTLMHRSVRRTSKKKATITDAKMLDLILNIDKEKPKTKEKDNTSEQTCTGHSNMNHKCKKDDDQKKIEEACDHQKESKRCECAYCEVFGNGQSNHAHKLTETRDRLRSRLNQRKEKIETKKETEKTTPEIVASVSKASLIQKGLPKTSIPLKVAPKQAPVKVTSNKCIHDLNIQSCQNCVPESAKTNISFNKDTKGTNIQNKVIEQKVLKTVSNTKPIDNPKLPERMSSLPLNPTSTVKEKRSDVRDIDELLNFIEGNKPIDKVALAQKKAAKKARQRQKREEERIKKEEEERAKQREEERIRQEKIREEERLKAIELAKQQAFELKKNKKNNQQKHKENSKSKRKKNSQTTNQPYELMEETIPAVVTIKRVVENNNSPPLVTITLKGSTPDQDKLICTLVNGHSNEILGTTSTSSSNNNKSNGKKKSKNEQEANKQQEQAKKNKKKKGGNNAANDGTNVTTSFDHISTKELRVTLAVDKTFRNTLIGESNKETVQNNEKSKTSKQKKAEKKQQQQQKQETPKVLVETKETEFDIPSLKLPPGITITKVSGPVANKNSKTTATPTNTTNSAAAGQQYPSVSKSGVIVVDTEKLIQQSLTAPSSKKSRKKKKKQQQQNGLQQTNTVKSSNAMEHSETKPTMVTLKNPIFHSLQKKMDRPDIPMMQCSEQASITKGENGMVTIRRPRCLRLPLENESPMSEFLSELKPVMEPEPAPHYPNPVSQPKDKDKCRTVFSSEAESCSDRVKIKNSDSFFTTGYFGGMQDSNSGLNNQSPPVVSAQHMLWGLPGIEITKVNKNAPVQETKKCEQTADVSIIPHSANGEKFNFDKDDWPYESVFAPKDILEDDLDAEERELEAFKRFCQQSVPPKHKEKVALNVNDIVLKKKYDLTYS